MDSRSFLGLEPTHNPYRWVLPVSPGICTRGNFLFGGCGLGAALVALEAASGRPTVWATAQYLAFAPTGSTLDLVVTLAAEGHRVTQARAVGRVGDKEILTVNAALGGPGDLDAEGVDGLEGTRDDLAGRAVAAHGVDRDAQGCAHDVSRRR